MTLAFPLFSPGPGREFRHQCGRRVGESSGRCAHLYHEYPTEWLPGKVKTGQGQYGDRRWLFILLLNDVVCHQIFWSTMIQVMACHLLGAKPFPDQMLSYWKLEQFSFKKIHLRMLSTKLWPFCLDLTHIKNICTLLGYDKICYGEVWLHMDLCFCFQILLSYQ